MNGQKIPDFSNFLEKFAAIETHLNSILSDVTPVPAFSEDSPAADHVPDEKEPVIEAEITGSTDVEQQCPGCKSILKPGDVFCSKCGYKIEPGVTVQENHDQKPLKCNSCDTPYTPGDQFCMNCGTKF